MRQADLTDYALLVVCVALIGVMVLSFIVPVIR